MIIATYNPGGADCLHQGVTALPYFKTEQKKMRTNKATKHMIPVQTGEKRAQWGTGMHTVELIGRQRTAPILLNISSTRVISRLRYDRRPAYYFLKDDIVVIPSGLITTQEVGTLPRPYGKKNRQVYIIYIGHTKTKSFCTAS